MHPVGQFELGHVTTVLEHHGRRMGECPLDVSCKARGHDPVALAPHEQRRRFESTEAVPEPLFPARFLEVDLAGGAKEGDADGVLKTRRNSSAAAACQRRRAARAWRTFVSAP